MCPPELKRATIEVTVRPKTGLPGYRERALERTLRRSTESVLLAQLHPRTSITIVVQVCAPIIPSWPARTALVWLDCLVSCRSERNAHAVCMLTGYARRGVAAVVCDQRNLHGLHRRWYGLPINP